METFYGRITGNFRVLDALATLAFDFPAGRSDRSAFFRDELEEFLVMCRREGLDPTLPKGSFAGAMGLPQFMPGSINRYAVDFDDDGRIDLHASAADVIGSVAHYLAAHGWQRGMADAPSRWPCRWTPRRARRCCSPTSCPASAPQQMAERWAPSSMTPAAPTRARWPWWNCRTATPRRAIVAGTQNFYAVTRYNWSSYYAMAVITLGEAVKKTTLAGACRAGYASASSRCARACSALSKMCGATPRWRSASPSLTRRNALVV